MKWTIPSETDYSVIRFEQNFFYNRPLKSLCLAGASRDSTCFLT